MQNFELQRNLLLKDFIEKNTRLIYEHKVDFYTLLRHYLDDADFISAWEKSLPQDNPRFQPTLSRYEYLYQLIPVFSGSSTAIFGSLLAFSNFNVFANILGNIYVFLISLLLSVAITVFSVSAIKQDLRKNEKKTSFINWFYMEVLNELMLQRKKADIAELETELKHKFNAWLYAICNQLKNALTPDIKNLESELIELFSEHNAAASVRLLSKDNRQFIRRQFQYLYQSRIEPLKIAPLDSVRTENYRRIITERKQKKNRLLNIKHYWNYFKTRVLDNRVVWETTISNFAMTAGFIGVLVGSTKVAAVFYKAKPIETSIAGDTSLIMCSVIIVLAMAVNLFCRLQGQVYSINRDQLFFKQVVFVNEFREIIKILNQL